eukprot:TRINITY_DN21038_c0_g1_i1.p1 TRINITY_DN21038_c0_g1~~TRINITY_DN21038_c0_g1_i1.p1  ORF type:complete len:322 (+),score=1.18 TRINITY_DN21038_c0_g1_i1:106-966(+)
MTQKNEATRTTRKIRFVLDVPRSWTTSPSNLLAQRADTYDKYVDASYYHIVDAVRDLLVNSRHHFEECQASENITIKKVYSIENFNLWQKYVAHIRSMRKDHAHSSGKCGSVAPLQGINRPEMRQVRCTLGMDADLSGDVNETLLLHGTTYENADCIVRSGFDNRICKRGMYGDGVYFASEFCKSHQYTCSRCTKACRCPGKRTVIIARVALGDPFYTDSTQFKIRRPPECRARAGLYDSIIANPGPIKGHKDGHQVHQEFVIFDMSQAYPSYVVEYDLICDRSWL